MEKINSFSLGTSVVALTGAPFWGIISSYLFNTSKNDIILSMLIGFIFSLLLSKLIITLFNRMPNKTIIGKFKTIYGKFSIIINIIYLLISLSIYIFLIYRLTSFLSSQYLINTSKIFMLFIVLITTFYIASKNIETVTRVSIISFYIAIFLYFFDSFSLINKIEMQNFLPLFTANKIDILKSSFAFSIYFALPSFFINGIKKDNISDPERFNKTYHTMYIISFVIIFLATIITLGIYGDKLCGIFDYSLYTVLKRIEILSFIDSIENISIMIWILYVINATSMILYSTINGIKETFNIKNKNVILIFLFILSIVVRQLFFMNNNYIESFNYLTLPLIVNLILLLIIIISVFLSKKKI